LQTVSERLLSEKQTLLTELVSQTVLEGRVDIQALYVVSETTSHYSSNV